MEDGTIWSAIGDIAKAAWAWLAPLPGLIAFLWAWRDRRWKRLAEQPYAVWEILGKTSGEWHMTELRIVNRWDEPIYVRELRLKGGRDALMTIIQPPSEKGRLLPWVERAARSLSVDITLSAKDTFPDNLYVRPNARITSGTASAEETAEALRALRSLILEINLTSSTRRNIRITAKAM